MHLCSNHCRLSPLLRPRALRVSLHEGLLGTIGAIGLVDLLPEIDEVGQRFGVGVGRRRRRARRRAGRPRGPPWCGPPAAGPCRGCCRRGPSAATSSGSAFSRTPSTTLMASSGFLQGDQRAGLAQTGRHPLRLGGIALGVVGQHLVERGQGLLGLLLSQQCVADRHARPHLVVGPRGSVEPGVVFYRRSVRADGQQQIADDLATPRSSDSSSRSRRQRLSSSGRRRRSSCCRSSPAWRSKGPCKTRCPGGPPRGRAFFRSSPARPRPRHSGRQATWFFAIFRSAGSPS